jgi:hypothetical protein
MPRSTPRADASSDDDVAVVEPADRHCGSVAIDM